MKGFIVERKRSNKDESTKAKEIFIIESERKANLVKKQKDVKSNFKATLSGDKEISRVKRLEFLRNEKTSR